MSFIERVPDQRLLRRTYDLWSYGYDLVASPWEVDARRQALAGFHFEAHDRVLDVGVGTGAFFAEIAFAAGPGALVCGVDLSAQMVRKAGERMRRGASRAALMEANALRLPFADESFDLVVSSYVLDLMARDVILRALAEFHRVLKSGGRAVLVNLTKVDPNRVTWYERCYEALPALAQAWLLGGCRPVQLEPLLMDAGFAAPRRTLVRQALASEVLVAHKPGNEHDLRYAA